MENTKDIILRKERENFTKSNFLISCKYKSSLLENKLMVISLSRADELKKDPENGILYQQIKVSEIKKELGCNGGSFYSNLANAAESMTSKSIGVFDPENKMFDYMSIIIRAHCEKGIFTIEYNPRIAEYIQNIKQNFTSLPKKIMLSFRSVYAFRIYEVLRSKCYYGKKDIKTDNDVFEIPFLLSELKLQIGVVNSNLDKVRNILNKSKNPDYDYAVEASPEKVLEKWSEFKRKALDPSINEINEKTDMEVSYDTERSGRGGKVHKIIFYVKYKAITEAALDGTDTKPELTQEQKDEIVDIVSDLIEEPVKTKDIRAICESAHYDVEKVKNAYAVLKKSTGVESVVGFMISAIKNGYDLPVPIKEKKENKNKFNNFEQREYSKEFWDGMERKRYEKGEETQEEKDKP